MNHQEMFEILVGIAIQSQWDFFGYASYAFDGGRLMLYGSTDMHDKSLSLNDVLFNHGFAKAIFGDDRISWADDLNTDNQGMPTYYQFHIRHEPRFIYCLSQMAMEVDPLTWAYNYVINKINEAAKTDEANT